MRAERGVTLVELMVSMMVASVVILAATQAVMVVTQAKRTSQRRLEVSDQASSALALIEFDADNAGYRFASPAFSVQVLNNVTGSGSGLEASLSPITATAQCGPADWGIAPGTDTVEFRYGFDGLVPGNNSPMTCSSGTCNVILGGGAASNPFSSAGPSGTGEYVLLTNATTSCLGQLTSNVLGTAMQMQLVGFGLANSDTSSFPGCASGLFTVMRLGRRVRYMVCQPPATSPELRPGLFRQEATGSAAFGTPVLVQEGIENLQVALRYDNFPPAAPLSGSGCTGNTCVCNRTTTAGECVGLNMAATRLDSTATAPAEQRVPFRLRGLDVAVTAISTRGQVARGTNTALEQFVRPALYDRAAGTALSGNLRVSRQLSLTLPNISVVIP